MMELAMSDTAVNSLRAETGIDVLSPYRVFVPAWTAYIRPCVIFLLFLVVGFAMAALILIPGLLLLLMGLGLFTYQVLYIASVRLFTQDDGVWIFSGIFPWNKGVYGVKWRDLDEALFTQGFFGWLFKSFKVTLTHRFTKDSEISMPHIKNGDQAAAHINALHIARIRAQGDLTDPDNEVTQV